jgi:hypothetical protein
MRNTVRQEIALFIGECHFVEEVNGPKGMGLLAKHLPARQGGSV